MTPAVDRLLWRLGAYERICQACAQGNVAPLRFLTFRPDKMRLRIGESLMRSQVPVIFAADLGEQLGALLPPPVSAPSAGALDLDREALRALLALSQTDGDLDPLDVHAWGAGRGEFQQMFAQLTSRFFDEARASGGGEDTAALFQLIALSSLRNVLLHRVGASERFLGIAALLAHLCDRALMATVEQEGDGLSARLGLLMAASCSPLSLMGAAAAVAARPANAYRTTPSAFNRARDLLRSSMDRPAGFDVTASRARIAAELLSAPERKRDLVRAMVAEGVRDLALLSTLTQGSELRDLASKTSALTDALFQPLGPDKLRARIERHPRGREEPLARLLVLVDSVGAVLAGDLEPLAKMGSIEGRADLAAAGAIVLAFDEVALEQGGHALAMVRPVPDAEASKARAEGRAYFFGLDDEPLFQLPRKRDEAFLFADMKDFTKRTVSLREESMGDFLKQHFYEPILRTCAHFARSPQARVSVVNLLGDAVACRGDVRSMVALSLSVRQMLAEAAQALADAQSAVHASDDQAMREIELEIARTERSLAAAPGDEMSALELDEQQRHLVELNAGRDERLTRIAGAGLEAGVFVTWGREATVIEVGGPEVGEWKVIIAEQLNAAARGTSRSASMAKARGARLAEDGRRLGRALIDPFQVHTAADPNDVSAGTDFHNAGAALTGEALAAYQGVSSDLVFRRLSVPPSSLPAPLHRYWLTRAVEEFVLCSDLGGVPALLFRFSGRTIFRGLEANGPLDIWEILLVDHGFGRDFVAALADAERARSGNADGRGA